MQRLGIDIGGSGIKGAPVDLDAGSFAQDRLRIPTPEGGRPADVAKVVAEIVAHFPDVDGPVGCTFPAVMSNGVALTAANVDDSWIGTDAQALFGEAAGREFVVVNDADAAGIAEMRYGAGADEQGVVLMLTLGTGIGSALFVDGVLVPNTEFGHIEVRGKDAEHRAADSVREKLDLGWKEWAARLDEAIAAIDRVVWPELILLGGGVSKKSDKYLPHLHPRARVIPARLLNDAGIIGAALATCSAGAAWPDRMDDNVDEVLVGTKAGKLAGRLEGGVAVFRGIPYAASTAGANRFRPPQPVVPWSDTRDASRFGPVAPQIPSAMEALLGQSEIDSSEDCLSLNVWTPGPDDRRRPVMVWIHGGAFIFGSGSTPWYDGTRFAAAGDAVVVTINYRLGAFGFCSLVEVGGAAFAGSGNAGILDQIAALEWVRDNIEAFGGNPDDVTIFGESAGAMSVGTLLGTPAADGLFHRAVLQSGAASFVAEPADAREVAERLMTTAGVSTVAELVDLPAEALLAAQQQMITAAGTLGLPFRPVVDGIVLPAVPLETIASGATGDVPILIGTNLDETTLFLALDPTLGDLDEAGLGTRARAMFGDHATTAVEHYRRNRPEASLRDVLVAITSDAVFRIPAIRLAEAQTGLGRPVYSYLFTWATPAFNGALGSTHTLEIPFVFDNLDQPGVGFLTGDGPERAALATTMHEAWIRFAGRTGNAGWAGYDTDRRATQTFDGLDHPVVDDPAGDERAIWEGIALRT